MAKAANISLPDEVMDRLDEESKKLGLNRSAYISMALNLKWSSDDSLKAIAKLALVYENQTKEVSHEI